MRGDRVERTTFADWPAPGPIDLAVHDLPHRSSTTEWWYVNTHVQTVDGTTLSLFAAFFRIIEGKDETTGAPRYAHSCTWALSDVGSKTYIARSRVDAARAADGPRAHQAGPRLARPAPQPRHQRDPRARPRAGARSHLRRAGARRRAALRARLRRRALRQERRRQLPPAALGQRQAASAATSPSSRRSRSRVTATTASCAGRAARTCSTTSSRAAASTAT